MFVTLEQIGQSLEKLKEVHPYFGMSYLAFKREKLPVGKTTTLIFARVAADLLDKYYRPSSEHEGYYTPFQPSENKSPWLSVEYNHRALQRITSDTFGEVTIHSRGSSEWGWRSDYVKQLSERLQGRRIPAFDLGVWLFREHSWPKDTEPSDLVKMLFSTFFIDEIEIKALFDVEIPGVAKPWIRGKPVSERELRRLIGRPPGAVPEAGAALEYLRLIGVGPATDLVYEPSERVNIITGDNSLGKTFLLDCIWWALTGDWIDREAQPKDLTVRQKSVLEYKLRTSEGLCHGSKVAYQRMTWNWPNDKRELMAGLVVYARHDGSFAVWDSAKSKPSESNRDLAKPWIKLDRESLWKGLKGPTSHGERYLCNGLIRDWVQWQVGGERYRDQYESLETCLKALSPPHTEPLRSGKPSRMLGTSEEIPTLVMPYGEVPADLTSAGVQRVIAIAYVLVWAWFEHLENSRLILKKPQRRLVLLIDEVEAHLHPKWQRVIVPALMNVIELLSSELTPQVHLATHSAMVMASTETFFDETCDDLHHLKLDGREVILEELPFVKRGTADRWLMSGVFELSQARSLEAETAIDDAKKLQEAKKPDSKQVKEVNGRLIVALAPDDDFWPRWRYFAKQHGVK